MHSLLLGKCGITGSARGSFVPCLVFAVWKLSWLGSTAARPSNATRPLDGPARFARPAAADVRRPCSIFRAIARAAAG